MSTATMSVERFIQKWQNKHEPERAVSQSHFIDVCRLVGHPAPYDSTGGADFAFEYPVRKLDGGAGLADVFLRGHFAIEYKSRDKYPTLHAAYLQLNGYREGLDNPPLLIVCDIANWEIHTNFPNTHKRVYQFRHADIARPEIYHLIQDLFSAPSRLHPNLHSEKVTRDAASAFVEVADYLERTKAAAPPDKLARFIMQLVFSMFAEDVRLLPPGAHEEKGVLTEILGNYNKPMHIEGALLNLFRAMQKGDFFGAAKIEYFNGSLYEDVQIYGMDSQLFRRLSDTSRMDWSQVEPSIFGTLFERVLDKRQRRQLGAHYTSADDVRAIVDPVLIDPLRAAWQAAHAEATPIRAAYDSARDDRARLAAAGKLDRIRKRILKQVRTIKVLDPACGSGNFLYVALRLLLDLEQTIVQSELWEGLARETVRVHPSQLFGMEINPNAHALASIVVWIGYLQWKYEHRYPLNVDPPILQDLSKKNIKRMDAILAHDTTGTPIEPDWVAADVIIGNPPFLGGNRIRAELKDKYVDDLFRLYAGRIGATADLVTYWFERARAQIAAGKSKRAGLIATNSIRGGANRGVLERIKDSGDIFMAHADRPWVLEGAAVRVSMVGFDDGTQKTRSLDGKTVSMINADLTGFAVDITNAKTLAENTALGFRGNQKGGAFDIDHDTARTMLAAVNASGRPNSHVIKRWQNGDDLVSGSRNMWLIDFGTSMPLETAALYEAPLAYVREHVKPDQNARAAYRNRWWIHAEARPSMRTAITALSRFIVTPHTSKHRIFAWLTNETVPDHALIVFARDDDYFFGVLHSRIHQVWSLRMGTSLGKGNDPRYTPTTTFETFPFPFAPGSEDAADPRVIAVADAARALDAERHAWLHADALDSRDRTLTNLYNARAALHGGTEKGIKAAAVAFAPRLDGLHADLDRAVCAAYGWEPSLLEDEGALLAALLALNAARA